MAERPFGATLTESARRPTGATFAGERSESAFSLPGPARRFFRGFNAALVSLTGAPVEAVDEALRLAGSSLLDEPGDAVRAVRQAFGELGIDASKLDSFADRVGDTFFTGTLMLFGGAGAARPLAKAAEQGPAIVRGAADLAKMIVTRPGVAVAAEAGGATGAETAAEFSPEGLEPIARFVGGMAGGMAAGGLTAARPRRTPNLPPKDSPSIRREGQPEAARRGVGERLTRRLEKLDDLIDRTIDRFARLDPDDVSIAGKKEIDLAHTKARDLQTKAWNEVDLGVKIEFDNAGSMMDDLLRETARAQRADIPNIAVKLLTRKVRGPKPGQTARVKKQSARELQGLRSKLLETGRIAASDGKKNKARIARDLAEAVRLDIEAANVDNEAFNAARAFSRRYNDIFTRGPIAQVLRFAPEGGEAGSARVVMQRLLRDPEGPSAIRTLGEQPEFGRRELIVEAENALRANFGEAAAAGRKPPKLRQQRRGLREFPEVARELVEANDLLRRTLARKKEVENGALARLAGPDSDVGIKRLIASSDPAGDGRRLVATLQGDPTALQGLRTGVIEELWRRGGADAAGFARLIKQPKIERLLQEVLSPGDQRRLARITAAATDISTIQQGILRTILTGTARVAARIGGAQAGRSLAGVTGGGTVQTPGIVARAASQTFDRLFAAIPAEKLLARAVVDTAWERTLLSRAPKDLPEVRDLLKSMRRLLGAEAGVRSDDSLGDLSQTPLDEVIRRVRAGVGVGP